MPAILIFFIFGWKKATEILLERFDLWETKNIVSDIRVFTATSMALPEIDWTQTSEKVRLLNKPSTLKSYCRRMWQGKGKKIVWGGWVSVLFNIVSNIELDALKQCMLWFSSWFENWCKSHILIDLWGSY